MTRRVVVTGLGIVSSLGNNKKEVQDSLYHARSGITFQPDYAAMGLRSHVAGSIKNLNLEELIDRKLFRFMAKGHAYAWLAMQEAIADSALSETMVSNIRTGLIVGAGGASHESILDGIDTIREKGIRRVGPYMVTKAMASGVSACLATGAKIKGVNYAITSACSTSAHCIGAGVEQIQLGKQDIIFAGGAEEEHWTLSFMFDGMGALSSKYNDTPEKASRTYDVNRDGFVISGGGGILVLEEYEHAKARNAKIYAEVVGYGATSDGYDMVAPSGEGAERCMTLALQGIDHVDYMNTHGTSTPVGDVKELEAIRAVFGDNKYGPMPHIASTKSLSGHALGAAGVNEAIYSLIMMENKFIAPSVNIEELDPLANGLPIVTKRIDNIEVKTAISNSFGFGGTNACLVFSTKNL
ncbi:beta-ketoacyl-ACP synthase I [Candidatus Methylopumilus universalis]|jgi:3-oxoacyl-[acyl-carrier-protein] synthase-1|uniref:3-oxoacyl-[acyl-carrier-protein] synthase 1 n=1 Tax=Candidatus Methylopumilus universalis TaxID=2588536 RepID=A0AAX1EZI1_9PROT|nr:beta-ketoacyl-ACP synthase I [Candidatus Methylopumilus universalis]QDC41000.1 beta-ketoacyl-ACP synthase I [Candidatus Methylopumilus universalis]QDC42291.1 beta-ketoacyl-ACP synthase I [Candidatus Methylopumilus universalis]QDC45974.1 beta-ketoacyl-ACP synthase I [Candidatus Methylopumilus universalis]QDC50975.1 beta-ketoacyl-ACP synthase I [Candidatus Methylopumilus universalis]QDC54677.1 beta-ketoacyl-ACP synthase I [Candidatus Methylopumilus universalis]